MKGIQAIIIFIIFTSCTMMPNENRSITGSDNRDASAEQMQKEPEMEIITGAEQMESYLPALADKRVAIVANQTSMVGEVHLVDTLFAQASRGKFSLVRVFAPEHGFRGVVDDGVEVMDEKDVKTGLPIVSLYGSNRKPTPEQIKDLDVVIFDIQDVGVRFYTFISTLHYVMEACAEQGKTVMVLDRPNPNGAFIDGPILDPKHRSFVGMHPIPVVHGLTVGELAQMINGEGWLKGEIACDLMVVPVKGYLRGMEYALPVKPSPNLPDQQSIKLYPSTCFFEGTVINEGRGTMYPFQVFGHPDLTGNYSYTPVSIEGMSMHPKLKGELCFGEDLRDFKPEEGWTRLYLNWLIEAYEQFPNKKAFFTPFFEKLSGTDSLRDQIIDGWSESEIRKSWEEPLEAYREMRSQYLIYDAIR